MSTDSTAQDQIATYVHDGERMAYQLGNRGPIKFNTDGAVDKEILDAYWHFGFYVFEGAVKADELVELQTELEGAFDRAPYTQDALLDSCGRPAIGTPSERSSFRFEKPLSDPDGGKGRHPAKMAVPDPPSDAPEYVISGISGPIQLLESCFRLYGHPQLLSITEAINGSDFTPFSESMIVKPAGLGPSVAWHQDGTTHWDKSDLDEGTHGFNFMFQYYGSTAANGVWVLPGSHKREKIDIEKMMADNSGSDRLPGAVPMVCDPGDIVVSNRQLLHASFPNDSPRKRVTFNFGFHRRSSILNVRKKRQGKPDLVYDEEFVIQRSRMIALAIDVRAQQYPDEPRYVYKPLAGQEDSNRWSEETRESILNNRSLINLSI